MLTLADAIRIYAGRRHFDGPQGDSPERSLAALSTQVGGIPLARITPSQILTFLNTLNVSPITWEKKYHLLRRFFDFWVGRGEIGALPMPPKRKPSPRVFIPYIYTRTEIRTLLKSVRASQKGAWCSIDAETLRSFLIFLYGTGAMINEAVRLLLKDVDLEKGEIVIRGKQGNCPRILPIGEDLGKVLARYLAARCEKKTDSPQFFLDKKGEALNLNTLSTTFKRLRRVSGIRRQDGARYQPRMHDLRPTFAVHRITGWMRHDADLNRMLPALATYMGQTGLWSSDRYLSLTPDRFRSQLTKLSPERKRKRRWRDDPELMKFLVELTQFKELPVLEAQSKSDHA